MLEHQETLYTIAEIAIALTGFSGIVMVFGKRVDSRPEEERVRLISMLRASLVAMFCSFLPLVVEFIITEPDHVWRVSSAILGTVMSLNVTFFIRSAVFNRIALSHFQKFTIFGGIAMILALFSSVIGLIPWTFQIFIIALIWMLFIASNHFVLLVVSSTSADTP